MDLFDQLPCAVFVTDDAGLVVVANAAMADLTGKALACLRDRSIDEVLTRPSAIFLQTHIWPTLFRDGSVKEIYLEVKSPGGGPVPVMVNCRLGAFEGVKRYFWTLFVARERRRFEGDLLAARDKAVALAKSLAEAKRFNGLVVDAIPRMLAYWDRNLICRFANQAYFEWFGKSSARMIGIGLRELLGETLFERNEPYIRGVLSGERQTFERDLRKPDGTLGITLATYIPDIVEGEVVGFVADVSDVTVLKATEAALRQEVAERQRALDLLDRSNAALREAQRLGQIGSWQWQADPDVTAWSEALHRMFGCDPGGPAPRYAALARRFTLESWRRLRKAVEQGLRTGAPQRLDLQFRRPDGRHGWIDARGEAVFDRSGRVLGLRGTAQDMTERKHTDIALHKTQDFLERTGALAGVGGWEVDLDAGRMMWSDQTCRLHDVEPGHRPSLEEALRYCPPRSLSLIENAVRACKEKGTAWDLDVELVSARGRSFRARVQGAAEWENGRVVRLVGAVQDVTTLTQVRRQLGEKSANLEATLENIDQGLVKVAADYTIQLFNRRFAQILDIPDHILAGPRPNFDDVLDYLDRRGEFGLAPEEFATRMRKRGQALVVGRHERRRPSGQILEVITTRLADGSFVATFADITARRRAEEASRDSEARWRIVVENIPAMIAYVDKDERLRFVNSNYCSWTGLAESEILGRSLHEIQGDDNYGDAVPFVRAVLAGERVGDQGEIERRVGNRRVAVYKVPHFDANGEVVGFFSFSFDVTRRYQMELALRDNEQRLQLITDNIPGLIASVDRDLVYRFVNRTYADWFQIDHMALVGTKVEDFYGEAVFAGIEPFLARALQGETVTGEREIATAGISRFCQVSLVPRRDEEGAVVGVFAFHTDITERRRMEVALRASQTLLARTGAMAGVGGWEFDLAQGAITWSDETCRLHDVAPGHRPALEEVLALYRPASRAAMEGAVREAIARGTPWDMEVELVSAKGRPFWARSTGAPEWEKGSIVRLVGAFQDITTLVQARRQLSEKSANLEATLENIQQGLVKVAADKTIELANRRFARILEIPDHVLDVPRPNFDDVMAFLDARGEFVEADEDLRRRVRQRGQALVVGRHERRRPNGDVIEVVTTRLPDGSSVATFADVTARRRAERALRESEARYRMLADTTSDVITQLDLDFVRIYVSPASRTMLGYDPEEMMGQSPSGMIHPDDAPGVRSVMELLAAGAVRGDRATTTNRMRHKDGRWIWLEAGINLVRDPDTGAPQSLICSLRDVTERQRAARHLERAKAAAEHAARIKADFLANMSHELRTPLTGILGIHDLLRADPALGVRARHYLDLAAEAGRSLLTIVNDVLDFSKIEAGQLPIEKIAFSPAAVIAACVEFGASEAQKKGLRLEARLPRAGTTLLGDPNRLRQIVLNLIGNALKFTATGGIVVEAGWRADTGRLRVEVSDTGIGIAADKLPHLFGRFSQADSSITRRYGGTGLGLAICKRLVELMGGDIGARSRLGEGSTFWFELPLRPAGMAEHVDRGDELVLSTPPCRILLAEDNMVNQTIIAAMIESAGHKVTSVGDGAAAVSAAEGCAFDVILLDLQMPVLDGLSAARAIRRAEAAARRPAVPIVGLTANAMADDVIRCRQAGMNAHVAKPIEWAELFATIARLGTASRQDRTRDARSVAAILDEDKLAELAGYIGGGQLAQMLEQFAREIERRLEPLATTSPSELAAMTHGMMALAGQLGFKELSDLCAEIEGEARQGAGLNRLVDLRAVAARASEAARASSRRWSTSEAGHRTVGATAG